jgi:hypothetical protein
MCSSSLGASAPIGLSPAAEPLLGLPKSDTRVLELTSLRNGEHLVLIYTSFF